MAWEPIQLDFSGPPQRGTRRSAEKIAGSGYEAASIRWNWKGPLAEEWRLRLLAVSPPRERFLRDRANAELEVTDA